MSDELIGQDRVWFNGYRKALDDLRQKLMIVRRGNSLISFHSVDEIILEQLRKITG